jgi:hypothetical protein
MIASPFFCSEPVTRNRPAERRAAATRRRNLAGSFAFGLLVALVA